jgi:hypothetical protein
VQANIQANTYVVSGSAETKSLQDLLPGILSQMGPQGLKQLSESFGKGGGRGMSCVLLLLVGCNVMIACSCGGAGLETLLQSMPGMAGLGGMGGLEGLAAGMGGGDEEIPGLESADFESAAQ